jgi:hypothetical protein
VARKQATVTITAEGRDQGKVFYITEMAAMQAERWATRVLLAAAKSGMEISDETVGAGMAGLTAEGMLKAILGVPYAEAEPLLAEMLTCVKIIPDPSNPGFMRSDIESDIEEVSTLVKLRAEVFALHTNFSIGASRSTSTSTTGLRGRKATPNT